MNITDNTVLITGGSSGIGLALARQLLELGNTVIVTGRDQARLDSAKDLYPGLHTIQSDASDPEAIVRLHDSVTSQFPAMNILINNAGIMRKTDFHHVHRNLVDSTREVDINLNAPIRMTAKFLPHLKRQKYAAIVNVSSGLAFFPLPLAPVYCATKAAIHSFTFSLRIQLKRTNIKVFELAPPMTSTPLGDAFDPEDVKGMPVMPVEVLARHAIKGMRRNRLEIRPGMSNIMKFIARIAPNAMLFAMLGGSVDRMLDPS